MRNKKTIALAMAAATVAPMAVPAFAAERAVVPSDNKVDMNYVNGRATKKVTTLQYDEVMRSLKAEGKNPKVVGQIKDNDQKTTHYYVSYDESYDIALVANAKKVKAEIETYLKDIKDIKIENTEKLRYTITTKTTEYTDGMASRTEVIVQDNLAANGFATQKFTFTNVDTKFVVSEDVVAKRGYIDMSSDEANEYKELRKAVYQMERAKKLNGVKITTSNIDKSVADNYKLYIKVFDKDEKTLLGTLTLTKVNENKLNKLNLNKIPSNNDFTKHWAEDAIVDAMLDNVISVTDVFNPNTNITRGDFAKAICNAFPTKITLPTVTPNFNPEYTDIASGDIYAKYVVALKNVGLMTGYPDGTFRPDATISRQEAAVVLAAIVNTSDIDLATTGKFKLADITTIDNNGKTIHKDVKTKFADDAKIPVWADEAVSLLSNYKNANNEAIISGYTDGTFKPANKITRAEAIFMIGQAR